MASWGHARGTSFFAAKPNYEKGCHAVFLNSPRDIPPALAPMKDWQPRWIFQLFTIWFNFHTYYLTWEMSCPLPRRPFSATVCMHWPRCHSASPRGVVLSPLCPLGPFLTTNHPNRGSQMPIIVYEYLVIYEVSFWFIFAQRYNYCVCQIIYSGFWSTICKLKP